MNGDLVVMIKVDTRGQKAALTHAVRRLRALLYWLEVTERAMTGDVLSAYEGEWVGRWPA